jgi:sulfotransferase
MPRSGSTLIQNILGNRPDFYCSPTSGVFDMLNSSMQSYTKNPVIKAQDEELMKRAFLSYSRFALQGFYEGITDMPYVVDKSRAWMKFYDFLDSFYPNPKVIVMIRDLRDIITSMEKNYRKHPEKWDLSKDLHTPETETIQERVNNWLLPNIKPVGDSLKRLKESINRGFARKFLFVKFEDLCENPQKEMDRIHKYLEISNFIYDFTNIRQVTFEDDKWHGKYGDHKIKPNITPIKSQATEILGKKICNQILSEHIWYFKFFNYEK